MFVKIQPWKQKSRESFPNNTSKSKKWGKLRDQRLPVRYQPILGVADYLHIVHLSLTWSHKVGHQTLHHECPHPNQLSWNLISGREHKKKRIGTSTISLGLSRAQAGKLKVNKNDELFFSVPAVDQKYFHLNVCKGFEKSHFRSCRWQDFSHFLETGYNLILWSTLRLVRGMCRY